MRRRRVDALAEQQHPQSRSFEQVAELYERARPSYPEEAVDWLVEELHLGGDSIVLDLGAGTGKLTRRFVARVGRVVAVEPGPEMLAQLRRTVPEAEPLLGAAEAIPLGDQSVDAVVCGQSFHWFRREEAVHEIRRVLRPGGGLGLIWNARDQKDPLQAEVTKLLEPLVPPGRDSLRVAGTRFVAEVFGNLRTAEFPFEQELDAEGLVERVSSISFVAAAPEAAREELQRRLRALVADRGESLRFRYRTEAYVSRA
jgi:ubiquinone/menaquinone biosynthesis C-methylase UbiE